MSGETLINEIEGFRDSIYNGSGLNGFEARRIAELSLQVVELLQEVAALATKADELEDDDDQDPAFAAAEAAIDVFWDAMQIVGFQKEEGTGEYIVSGPLIT